MTTQLGDWGTIGEAKGREYPMVIRLTGGIGEITRGYETEGTGVVVGAYYYATNVGGDKGLIVRLPDGTLTACQPSRDEAGSPELHRERSAFMVPTPAMLADVLRLRRQINLKKYGRHGWIEPLPASDRVPVVLGRRSPIDY